MGRVSPHAPCGLSRWIDAEPLGNDPYARPPRSRQSLTDSFLQRRGYRVLIPRMTSGHFGAPGRFKALEEVAMFQAFALDVTDKR